ncbi:hypothetical protein [Pseudomonas sp.]|uniref:hypothetical protein n=1 Tax=Pseudomonas sp. TaxID=306 RepID=UPI00289A8360|nr:hypothetical protein [Pseudomonas sp.]
MMKKISILTITLSFVASYTSAASKDGSFAVLQLGNDSCGSFTAAAQKGTHQNNWADWNRYASYAFGYFTGINNYFPDTTNILGGTDYEGAMANIEKYCQENPLKKLIDALDKTAADLYSSRKK